MMLILDIQRETDEATPDDEALRRPAELALRRAHSCADHRECELSLRIVDREEMQALNRRYRGKDRPTNVLAFPAQLPPGLPEQVAAALLGDIVICAPIVREEAARQVKDAHSHWDHMLIHGILHLLGFDHEDDSDAIEMESLETALMAELGWPDPYADRVADLRQDIPA